MKNFIRNFIRKIYFFAFPGEVNKVEPICRLGKNAKIYNQAFIYNPSGNINNIIIGENTHIAGNLSVSSNAGRIEIGNNSFIGENSRIWSAKSITIGDRVQVAHGCNIFDNNIHSINSNERHLEYIQNITQGVKKLYDLNERDLIIKDDAWIGACVIVLKGVTIGRGAIIGAGSVVLHDIPDFVVAVGNPARVIRKLN